MDEQLLLYRQQIDQQPYCVDPSFQEHLSRYRTGDEIATRWISGSCLRIAYEIAVQLENLPAALSVIERIEEANAGLWKCISSFNGSSADEFIEHARQSINARLESWKGKAA